MLAPGVRVPERGDREERNSRERLLSDQSSLLLTHGGAQAVEGDRTRRLEDSWCAMAGSQRAFSNVRTAATSLATTHVGWQQGSSVMDSRASLLPLQALVRAARQLLHDGRSAGSRPSGSLRRRFMSLGNELPSDLQAQVSAGARLRIEDSEPKLVSAAVRCQPSGATRVAVVLPVPAPWFCAAWRHVQPACCNANLAALC